MKEKEYREHPAISRSELARMSESPEKFKYYREHPEPPTPALIFGQLFHAMVLQPETVKDEFAIAPIVDKRTKEGKAEFAAFEESSIGKTVITAEMFEQAEQMAKALYQNEYAQKLLRGEKERPFFWVDDLTGEECKCRTDCLTELADQLIIVDLKTTDNAETKALMKSAVKYQYDLQAGMYCEGVRATTGKEPIFVFMAIEKKPPYAVNILLADDYFMKRGYDLFREYIGMYHQCKSTGNWFGYLGEFNHINYLSLPSYLVNESE